MINRISNFKAAISSLQNPSFLFQLLSLSGIDEIPRFCSFWKWGALIVAILATFSAIINKIKILVIRFQAAPASNHTFLRPLLDDSDFDDSCSSSDSDDDDYDFDDEDEKPTREIHEDEVFHVKGFENQWQRSRSSNLQTRRSIGERLSEFAFSKSVVNLWENIGLGLGLELEGDSASGEFIQETNEDKRVNLSSSFSSISPPAVIFSSAIPAASLRLWDTRASSKKPAIIAEWQPQVGDVGSVSCGGVAKLYLRDGGKLAAVVDLRKVSTPLDNVAESDVGEVVSC